MAIRELSIQSYNLVSFGSMLFACVLRVQYNVYIFILWPNLQTSSKVKASEERIKIDWHDYQQIAADEKRTGTVGNLNIMRI